MIFKKYEYPDLKPHTDCRHTVYLDIETSGLSRHKNHIILIGICFFRSNGLELRQYFAENLSEEKEILIAFQKDLSEFKHFVSFNGNTFDIPFLNSAFEKHHIPFRLPDGCQEDLLAFLRPLKEQWGLSSLKLKSVEEAFDIHRKDTISGKESLLLYKAYQNKPNPIYLHNILLHNAEDVKHLAILHRKISEKMIRQSKTISFDDKILQIFLHRYTKKNNLACFHFKNIRCDLQLHYFDEQGNQLTVEKEESHLQMILSKGRDPFGQAIDYTELIDRPFPVFCENELLSDSLYAFLEHKISEIYV